MVTLGQDQHKENGMDLKVGDTFGRLTVISDETIGKGTDIKYLCRCSCENKTEKYIKKWNLIYGNTKSCGCLALELSAERKKVHGEAGTRLYQIWTSMKGRCYNPNNEKYNDYGARNITVCDEWKDNYTSFRDWSYQNGYDDSLNWTECTIDRINNEKGYSPDNCRWTTVKIQGNNKRNNVVIEYNGVKKTASEWAREIGVDVHTIIQRYRQGRPIEEVLAKNLKTVWIEYNGKNHTIPEWVKITGIKKTTIWSRYDKGYPPEMILYKGDLRNIHLERKVL